jgi:DNA-binding NarL/FixJ family response regulator
VPAGSGGDAPRLSERETEILRMVATGMSYKQIATRLVLSHRTVQNHVQNTLGKLQLHNRVELVRYAIEHGLAGESETSGT